MDLDLNNIEDDWETFLQGGDIDVLNNIEPSTKLHECTNNPKCSPIYISTKTMISYLNISDINIKEVFWKIPILEYANPKVGVLKKQIKYSSTSPTELEEIEKKLTKEKYYDEQIIEHIDNPEGRIKFKDQRKISVGISKKDILSYRSKKKRAFFNCFVLILRIYDNDMFKEMHVKVFNTGKLEIPGIQSDELLVKVLDNLIDILKPCLGVEDLSYSLSNETVLINSNFTCGYYINRDKLHDILKYKYRINSNYDACSYPGIQCKFYYDISCKEQNGQQPIHKDYMEISFMIFRTGSVLIVGKCTEDILSEIYEFVKNILEVEYMDIKSTIDENQLPIQNKNRKRKIRKKIIEVLVN